MASRCLERAEDPNHRAHVLTSVSGTSSVASKYEELECLYAAVGKVIYEGLTNYEKATNANPSQLFGECVCPAFSSGGSIWHGSLCALRTSLRLGEARGTGRSFELTCAEGVCVGPGMYMRPPSPVVFGEHLPPDQYLCVLSSSRLSLRCRIGLWGNGPISVDPADPVLHRTRRCCQSHVQIRKTTASHNMLTC